ncbi:hypothetical protein ACW9I8_04450 [Pseudomonas reactans]
MGVTSYMRIEESVDAWLEPLTSVLTTIPTQIIECTSIATGTNPVAMLDRSTFLKACQSLKPAVVFIHKEHSLLEEQLAYVASQITDVEPHRDALEQDFLTKESDVMTKARNTCLEYSSVQCFFTSGGVLITTGCEVGDYQDFTEALDRFKDTADEAIEMESSLDQIKLNNEMKKIAEVISRDQDFISIRGRRKRAIYVLKRYRQEIPESPYVERPDQGSDPIDRNIVLVARQAADILEFGV